MSMVTYPLNNIEYTAEDAELFHSTRTSGVYATDSFDYSVTGADNSIVIGTGIAWIKNRQFSGKVVAQKEPMSLDMGLPDPAYPRIDAVVIQFNSNKNATEIVVKNGAASSFPIAPEVVRTESLYELHLYHVRREAGSLSISAPNVTDLRNNNAYCGLMSDSITQAVDSTLSKNGVAADAAAVGNALAKKAPAGYGLGEEIATKWVSDCNDAIASGLYRVNANSANCFIASATVLRVEAFTATTKRQTLMANAGTASFVTRFMTGGVWGEWEWINPPMVLGVEYRTTERWQGKAVYTKLINCGSFYPAGSMLYYNVRETATRMLRVTGTAENGGFSVPFVGAGESVHISATVYEGEGMVGVYVDRGDLTADKCIAQVWYTKN